MYKVYVDGKYICTIESENIKWYLRSVFGEPGSIEIVYTKENDEK